MKLVLIKWIDSHSSRGWQDLDRLKETAEPLCCESVGWLLESNSEVKVIVPHISADKEGNLLQGNGDIAIPTKAIIKMIYLKK